MSFIRRTILFSYFTVFALTAHAQLVVTQNQSAAQLVQHVLLGNSIVAYNIKYTGAKKAIGYFDGTHSNIGLKNGVLMTTGDAALAVGPNNVTNAGVDDSLPGDSALTAISGDSTFDACILEFDFVPYSDTVSFDFAFGSEEYPAFTCCKENDVFAFFISGPGITGTKNIALVPGTTTPISINTINGNCTSQSHCGGACCNSNSAYYIDNTGGATVQYNGFTTVMKAESDVQCGQVYHIRIAIADGGDPLYDSGVFLGGGSFRGGTTAKNITILPTDSICPNDKVTIYYPDNNASHIFNWSFDGANIESGSGSGPYVVDWSTSGAKEIKLQVSGPCAHDNDSLVINVGPCDVQVPNIFTPGSGDKNGTFYIFNLEKYPNSNLKIFNRWGTLIYSSQNYQNDWAGGNTADGTYYYILTLENREVKKGFITLVRK